MTTVTEHGFTEFAFVDNNEIALMLERYHLSRIIDDTLRLLKNPDNQVSDIGVISSCLLVTVNHHIEAVKKRDQRSKIELLLADLAFDIYIDFLNKTPLDAENVIEEIVKSSIVTCNLSGHDFNIFKKLIDFYKLNSIINPTSKNKYLRSPDIPKKKCKLIWNGKGRLEELIYQLQKRKLIKTKLQFFNLFAEEYTEQTRVKWDFDRKAHLAHLLYQLHAKDHIRLIACKGYFSFAEKHFIGFDDTALKKDSLKKLSSSMNTEPSKYHHVISEVNDIIKAIVPH